MYMLYIHGMYGISMHVIYASRSYICIQTEKYNWLNKYFDIHGHYGYYDTFNAGIIRNGHHETKKSYVKVMKVL